MKHLLAVLIAFAFVFTVNAQDKVFDVPSFEVGEEVADMAKGIKNGLNVFIPDADEKTVIKEWEKTMKDNRFDKKSKVSTSKNETTASNIVILGNPMDIYANFYFQDGGVKVLSFYDMGDTGFVSSTDTPDKYTIMEQFLSQFAKNTMKVVIKNELNDEQKAFKKLEGEKKKLEKENTSLHKDIENYKKKIKEAEEDIVKNEQDQENKLKELQAQEAIVKFVEGKLTKF